MAIARPRKLKKPAPCSPPRFSAPVLMSSWIQEDQAAHLHPAKLFLANQAVARELRP